MRIGIVGAGSVGTSLATGLAAVGHEVTLGTRDPAKDSVAAWLDSAHADARATAYADAVEGADLVIFAVPGRVLIETVDDIGSDSFDGMLIIDPSNPVVFEDGETRSAFGGDDSAAEALQRALPRARVVKAFNQIPAADMVNPPDDTKLRMRIAGDDEAAKAEVSAFLESLGWTVRDLGPLSRSRALEQGVIDWIGREASPS